jgi:thioredoxin-like negative regulator of GroEL
MAAEWALVEFYGQWCLYSALLKPKIASCADRFGSVILVGSLDVDRNAATARKLRIEYVPAVALLHRGSVVESWYGDTPLVVISDAVERHV